MRMGAISRRDALKFAAAGGGVALAGEASAREEKKAEGKPDKKKGDATAAMTDTEDRGADNAKNRKLGRHS
jgi:hypothetical protein